MSHQSYVFYRQLLRMPVGAGCAEEKPGAIQKERERVGTTVEADPPTLKCRGQWGQHCNLYDLETGAHWVFIFLCFKERCKDTFLGGKDGVDHLGRYLKFVTHICEVTPHTLEFLRIVFGGWLHQVPGVRPTKMAGIEPC